MTPRSRFGLVILAVWLIALLPAPNPHAESAASARAPERHRHGLLWRVQKPGGAPSHLFGTLHSADARVLALAAPVQQAFDRASSYTMELVPDGAGLVTMAETMYFNDGRTLRDALGEALYQRTEQALTEHGLPVSGIEKQKPWVVAMALATPPSGDGLFLDLQLQLRATLAGKPVHGLETMAEQLAVFNELPLADQVTLVAQTLDTLPESRGQLEELTRAYLARDLGAMLRAVEAYRPKDAALYNRIMTRLLDDRNERMLDRIETRLAEGNAFIAVGAAHLPGPRGLLALLERRGYAVAAVY